MITNLKALHMDKKSHKTAQRAAILEYLRGNTDHPSAAHIYEAVSRQLSAISLTTVYNTLMHLERKGLVQEVPSCGSAGKRFDPNAAPHDHLICRSCNAIFNLDPSLRPPIGAEHLHGFDPKDIVITVYGLCPDCSGTE